VSVSTVDYPVSIAVSPDGGELIATEVEEGGGVVESFGRRPDGTLLSKESKATPSGGLAWGLAISPDGQDAYVTSRLSSGTEGLWQLGFGPSGELEALTPAFVDTGAEPALIAIATREEPSSPSPPVVSPVPGPSPAPSKTGASSSAPTANAVVSQGARKRHGESFTFDATLSVDPGGTIVAYRWTLGGRVLATTPRFHHFLSNAHRSYSLTLTVLDDKGRSATTHLTVSPRAWRAPVMDVTIPATANFCVDCAQPWPAVRSLLRRLRRYARDARSRTQPAQCHPHRSMKARS
jgi:hypothetical protein